MATLEQIRVRVARKSQDASYTSLSASVVDGEINRAIRFYQNQQFWFNEDMTTITLTEGSNVIPNIPADVISELQVNGLTLIDQQVKIDLKKLPTNLFVERDFDQTGRPLFYTFRNNQYLLSPIPQEAYTLQFRWLKLYADLVNDSDTNDFTENAEDLIMLHTLKNIYAEDKEDTERGLYYQGLEDNELKSLQKRNDARLSTGVLTINPILTTNYY
jgi:hypothetical protein